MRDFSADTSALALNTATPGHNLDGYGAGWPVGRVIDACAAHGFGVIVFWRREIGGRAVEIGNRARAAGLDVTGLCRTPYLVGSAYPESWRDDILRRQLMVSATCRISTVGKMFSFRATSMFTT